MGLDILSRIRVQLADDSVVQNDCQNMLAVSFDFRVTGSMYVLSNIIEHQASCNFTDLGPSDFISKIF